MKDGKFVEKSEKDYAVFNLKPRFFIFLLLFFIIIIIIFIYIYCFFILFIIFFILFIIFFILFTISPLLPLIPGVVWEKEWQNSKLACL